MKRAPKRLVMGGLLLGAAALAWLALRPEAVAVETTTVARGPVRVLVEEDGETRVRERYVVSAPVAGRMLRLECEAGDAVAAGDVIARIHPLPLDTRDRAQAAGRLEAAEAAQRAADARVEQAAAALAEAKRQLDRTERMARGGFIAEAQLDAVRTAERTAALEHEAAARAAEAAAHDAGTARAALLGSAGAPAGSPTLVRAPAAGRILRVHQECERAVAAGSPILEIGDPADLELVIDVLSQDAARIREGTRVLVTTGADADTLAAHVVRVEPAAFTKLSPLGVEEQRVNVIAALDDDAAFLGDRFRIEVAIVIDEADDVVTAPIASLVRGDDGWAVFVVESGRATLRPIELGRRGIREAEIRAGLEPGEIVVVYPGEDLEEGVRVRDERDR